MPVCLLRLRQEEWAVFKPQTPHGGFPVLDINGKLLAGRGPIQCYVMEEFGLTFCANNLIII